jgi:hypothetical protein
MSGSSKKRRQAKLYERTEPCECCQYPITQRHHLFGVAEFGEGYRTVQLCANCHELYHVIERDTQRASQVILYNFIRKCGKDDPRLNYLRALVKEAKAELPAKRRQAEHTRQYEEAEERAKEYEHIPRGTRYFYRISSFDDCLIQRRENKDGARWVHFARLDTADRANLVLRIARVRDSPALWKYW